MTNLHIFTDLEGKKHTFTNIKKAFECKKQYDLKYGLEDDLTRLFSKDDKPQTYIYPSNTHKERKKRKRKEKINI